MRLAATSVALSLILVACANPFHDHVAPPPSCTGQAQIGCLPEAFGDALRASFPPGTSERVLITWLESQGYTVGTSPEGNNQAVHVTGPSYWPSSCEDEIHTVLWTTDSNREIKDITGRHTGWCILAPL